MDSHTLLLRCSAGEPAKPVYIGLDAEFGYKGSTSAEAIERGILIAIEEINKAGGVLNGRPLALLNEPIIPCRRVVY